MGMFWLRTVIWLLVLLGGCAVAAGLTMLAARLIFKRRPPFLKLFGAYAAGNFCMLLVNGFFVLAVSQFKMGQDSQLAVALPAVLGALCLTALLGRVKDKDSGERLGWWRGLAAMLAGVVAPVMALWFILHLFGPSSS